ncbi:hypothetical protein N8927_02765 [Crocinitomicaceae bacterium]|jgi:hypothetical protein|nr:hypothetical protein [Crocinitomicaceae bacterium]
MQEIRVIFSSKCKQNTLNLIESIQQNHSINFNIAEYKLFVHIIDKSPNQNLSLISDSFDIPVYVIPLFEILTLEDKYEQLLKEANCSRKIDSIQRTRIQQQIVVLELYSVFKKSIIWQVDDDMLFAQSRFKDRDHSVHYHNNYFSELTLLNSELKEVDCLIGPSTFAPPIPSLLYCKTQLSLLFHKQLTDEDYSLKEYHDYYSERTERSGQRLTIFPEEDVVDLTRKIILGHPITAFATKTGSEKDHLAPSRLLRGGNFIILNPEIFTVPHLGYVENDGLPARRSDMIHAHLLSERGFDIRDTNHFSLIHNRNFNSTTIHDCVEKYHTDMIGSLLVQYLFKSPSDFRKRLKFHKGHIKDIIGLIKDLHGNKHFRDEIHTLEQLDESIQRINEADLINEFKKFDKKKNKRIKGLCKLA